MRKIITLLMMALLLVGSADAQKKTRKKTRGKARTTATTKAKTPAATPIGEPQMVFDMNNLTYRGQEEYKKALAGDAYGQYTVGPFLELGHEGFPKNKPEALRWYYLAAKQGYSDGYWCNACYEIGEAYDSPFLFDDCIKENDFEAAKWYAKAATKKDKEAKNAIESLNRLLQYNRITPAQYEIAMNEAGASGSSYMNESMKQKTKDRKSYNETMRNFAGIWTCPSSYTQFKFDSSGNGWFRNGSGRAWETLGVTYISYNCISVYDAHARHTLEISGSTMIQDNAYVYRRR